MEQMREGVAVSCEKSSKLPLRSLSIHSYQNVRIDAIHFCGRLSVTSKKRGSFNAAVQINDPARKRMGSFVTTIRHKRELALSVHTLKIPYMTREAAYADIARAVAAPLTALRFIDLPEGICRNDPSSVMLKAELEANCPNLRWWKVSAGGEDYLTKLEEGLWPFLEELTLSKGLLAGSQQLARVVSSLPALSKAFFLNIPHLDDELFAGHPYPMTLRELTIQGAPGLTARGLMSYASHPAAGQALKNLVLIETGIEIERLPQVLASCLSLEVLHVTSVVKRPFPLTNASLLASNSLKRLKYEISASTRRSDESESLTESYYNYLAASIQEGSLPSLVHLFALSARFPYILLRKASSSTGSDSQLAWLRQTLRLYTKPEVDLEWDLTVIDPHVNPASAQQSTRPLSLINSQPSTPFGGAYSRKSVMVGNGFGGFLMVPEQHDPMTPNKKSPVAKDRDEWWAS